MKKLEHPVHCVPLYQKPGIAKGLYEKRTSLKKYTLLMTAVDGFVAFLPFLFAMMVLTIWIWALVECLTKESNEGNTKIAWTLVILFGSVFGGILYFVVRRPRRFAELHH